MIDVALAYTRSTLDQYLARRLGLDSGKVILNSLSNSDSHLVEVNRNKVVITLINMEYETNKQFYGGQRRDGDSVSHINPSIHFNLDILISANFDDYAEALKHLTLVIAFFQENLTLDRVNHPSLPDGLIALKIEIENSSSAQTHNLWTALGVSYLPSIVYKIRHVAVQSGEIKGVSSVIQGISGAVRP